MRSAADRLREAGPAGFVIAASYAVLGVLLLVSRFVGLGRSYASDELMTVRGYVGAGLGEILTGPYVPNNHELFSLFGWATWSVVGESAIALRLWSAVPFVLGALIVTAWLHLRVGPVPGLLFLFLVTASPLLLDITRQARGYGLAFLAGAVLTVAALEGLRSRRTSVIATFCIAGVVGTWTLPNFGLAFVATGLALLSDRGLRRPVVLGLVASLVAIFAWYSPHLADILESSRQEYGAPIETAWLLTAPLDQVVVPAFAGIDEILVEPTVTSLVAVIALAAVMASSPLLRARPTALVLLAGTVVSIATVWITQTNVAPRFLSFLLVPLLMLVATGAAATLAGYLTSGRHLLRAMLVLTVIALVGVISVWEAFDILRLPREAAAETAEFIREHSAPTTPVYAYVPYPRDLERYLGKAVVRPRTPPEVRAVCTLGRDVVLVTQPWILEPVAIPCASRMGIRRQTLEQYARGGRMDVWLIPPAA
jgi:hypothetical protein